MQGLKYLYIYIASVYGVKNVSDITKIEWVERNKASILALEPSFFSDAVDKLEFLKLVS